MVKNIGVSIQSSESIQHLNLMKNGYDTAMYNVCVSWGEVIYIHVNHIVFKRMVNIVIMEKQVVSKEIECKTENLTCITI